MHSAHAPHPLLAACASAPACARHHRHHHHHRCRCHPRSHAGIGGLSEALGWTEVQQEEQTGQFFGGAENIFKLVALVLAADMALFAFEFVSKMIEPASQ